MVKGMSDVFRRYKQHWTQNSKMPAVYEHLSRSIIPSIQNETWKVLTGSHKAGSEPVKQGVNILLKLCKGCEYENPRDSGFCNRCGFTLDGNNAVELSIANAKVEELLDKLTDSPEKLGKLLDLHQH